MRIVQFITKPTIIIGPGNYLTRKGEVVTVEGVDRYMSWGKYSCGTRETWDICGRLLPFTETENDIVKRLPVICTSYVYPPIPLRSMDWHAWLDGTEEDGPHGWGETEQAAIDALKENLADLDEPPADIEHATISRFPYHHAIPEGGRS